MTAILERRESESLWGRFCISSLSLISISAIIIIIVVTPELTSHCGRDYSTWLVSLSFITGLLENSSSNGIGDPFPVTSGGVWASS
jgi:hypothetical protein